MLLNKQKRNDMLYDQNLENAKMRERAKELLDECKKAERKYKLHEVRLNKNTVVYCKKKDQIEKYKKKEKETLVFRTEN